MGFYTTMINKRVYLSKYIFNTIRNKDGII